MIGKEPTETLTRAPLEIERADAGAADARPAAPVAAGPFSATDTATGPNRAQPGLLLIEAAHVPADLPALPPSLVERYECTGLLGRGGMGAVYRARDRQLGRDVALKFLFGSDPDGRLLQEARAQARLDHPNACKVYEVGVANGTRYLAMQLIDGAPFDALRDQATLEAKLRIVHKIALALHEVHRLGLVHRDVKPSNIMVERAEDGSWTPFLMDFGIARDMGDQGQTATGAIAGTPSFMAPEQARGEVRSLDRRADVYSLGATLYDVLAGRPPFTAPDIWQLLEQIKREEAPPIRRIHPEVPEDVEAILVKCLEKEPHRRYDSAKALAEDLQRFLDGDPIRARRLSPGYVLFKKARKHRVLVALAASALVAALVLTGAWFRARRLAAEQANLSRELGEDAKAMEGFLRTAYGLPLHDIEQEKDVVRARLRGVEARMAAAGRMGEGPGHYALGRGYLALQEPEQARSHLQRASEAGYASPDLDYAMGLALGELYTRALEEARRIDNPERKQARIATLAAEYREPALQHLRRSLAAESESAAYVEGMIALYEGKYEDAITRAREGFAKAPWLYEMKKLEGDARFALGSRFRADAAFDFDRMMAEYQRAAAAYRSASEIARSDPQIYEGECELWTQAMNGVGARREALRPSFENARAACDRAIAASSKREAPHLKLAFVQASFAWFLAGGVVTDDPADTIEAALAQAREAMRRSPDDPMAPYVMGYASLAEAQYLNNRGLDSRPSIDRGVAAYEQALRMDPTFLWALGDLGTMYLMKIASERFRGLSPATSVATLLAYCDRAKQIDPSFLGPRDAEIAAHLWMADYLVDTGGDPASELRTVHQMIEAGRPLSRDWPAAGFWLSNAQWIQANHELDAWQDPSASIEEGMRVASDYARVVPGSVSADEAFGKLGAIQARYLMRRGQDPEPALRKVRESFQRAMEANPWDLGYHVWRARVEILHIRWASRQHRLAAKDFEIARAPLLPLLDKDRVDPRLYQALAEIRALEAAWLLEGKKQGVEEAIRDGLAMAERALALNPHMSSALLARGDLLLARAHAVREPERRREAARGVEEALLAASRENPLLERDVQPVLTEARTLLGARMEGGAVSGGRQVSPER